MSLQIVSVQNNELLIINHYWLSKPVKILSKHSIIRFQYFRYTHATFNKTEIINN